MFFITLFLCINVSGQFDTTYYLPPLWTTSNSLTNTPTKLVISTAFSSSKVNIRTADGKVFNKNFTVNKESPIAVDLNIALGNTRVFNQIENTKGLIITSTKPVQVVHINDSDHNKTYTVLKGSSALGTNFYAASQTKVLAKQYRKDETHFISVMATEDHTQVSIKMPNKSVLEGVGNVAKIELNAFETYVVKNKDGTNVINNITGAHITANKDIVVVSGSQHIRQNNGIGGAAEGGVDQLVPVKVLGTEYIVSRGGTALDYAVVVATEPNTTIYVDGKLYDRSVSLNSGQFLEVDFSEKRYRDASVRLGTPHYISSDKPIYVFHVSGLLSDEVGMALIPPIGCTGSKTINFLKFDSGFNIATLIIENEGLSNFTFNGNGLETLGVYPQKIPGKDDWSIISIPKDRILRSNIVSSPDSFFHLSLLVASPASGTYGLLSGFEKVITALDPFEKLPIEDYSIQANCGTRENSIHIPIELDASCGNARITSLTTNQGESTIEVSSVEGNEYNLIYNTGESSSFFQDTITVDFESTIDDVVQASGSVTINVNIPPNANRDNDSLPDCSDPDDDNDGILDAMEYIGFKVDAFGDEDGDGIQNFLDLEDNGNSGDGSLTSYINKNLDTVPDIYDFDGDGIPNHIDLDSDNDGIPDNVEAQLSTEYRLPSNTDVNLDGIDDSYPTGINVVNTVKSTRPDFLNLDTDNDGYNDTFEAFSFKEKKVDEFFIGDTDADGLDDFFDASIGSFSYPNGVQVTSNPVINLKNTDNEDEPDFRDLDDDNDQLSTKKEKVTETNPYNADTDNDGLTDGEEVLGLDQDSTIYVVTFKSNPNNQCDPLNTFPNCDIDGDGNSNRTDPNPESPVAENDYFDIREGETLTGAQLLENDDFLLGNYTTITNLGLGTAKGVVLLNSKTGQLTYEPFKDEIGRVTFVYEVCNTENKNKVCATATVEIFIEEYTDLVVYNAVSPNDDGYNDYLIIKGVTSAEDFTSCSVMIFDSIGEIVYKESEYKGDTPYNKLSKSSQAFKGLAKHAITYADGEELPSGTYFYEVNYTLTNGTNKSKNGYLFLDR